MRWVLLLMLLAGCAVPEESGSVDVFFCPQEDCYGIVTGLLQESSHAECALYAVRGAELLSLLEEKASLVMDGKVKVFPDMPLVKRFGRGLMHDKFCVLDDDTFFTGS